MAEIRVNMKLCVISGGEEVQSVIVPITPSPQQKQAGVSLPPYKPALSTAPAEPTLVQSATFVRLA